MKQKSIILGSLLPCLVSRIGQKVEEMAEYSARWFITTLYRCLKSAHLME